MKRFDLRSLHFDQRDEAWRRLPVEVDPFVFGGCEFAVAGGGVDLEISAGRVGQRVTLTGSFATTLEGPCQRCLEPAEIAVEARGVEVVRQGQSEGVEGDEAYVDNNILDAEAWIRDLIAESLPDQLLCRADCRGLCPVCGANLNAEPEHTHADLSG